ncbi:MAG: hypothetical protein HYT41_01710 [Candidatus Sungbacteria bacterium]|nr:hypothetical protein [Candidatus Sungbacteria bacterium]
MSIFNFRKRFGGQIYEEEAKSYFVNQINHFLFRPLDKIFDFLCLGLNRDPHKEVTDGELPSIQYLTSDEFEVVLAAIEILHDYFKISKEDDRRKWLSLINQTLKRTLKTPLSLGIRWQNGKFYPEGAMELDEKLIGEVLLWLDGFPKPKSLYENALNHYIQTWKRPILRKDVIINSFQAVEELTKIFLQSTILSFDKNFPALAKKLSLNQNWSQILYQYKELSKEFGRHPGRNESFIPRQSDTEAFLYLSGLIMRLILQHNKQATR